MPNDCKVLLLIREICCLSIPPIISRSHLEKSMIPKKQLKAALITELDAKTITGVGWYICMRRVSSYRDCSMTDSIRLIWGLMNVNIFCFQAVTWENLCFTMQTVKFISTAQFPLCIKPGYYFSACNGNNQQTGLLHENSPQLRSN